MPNTTTGYEDSDSTDDDWTISMAWSQILNALLVCFLIYLTGTVIIHGCRERLWTLSTRKGKLHVAGTVSICCAFPRLLLDQLYFHLHEIPGALDHCELFVDITNACCALALFSTYIFLWLRQWMIYTHPSMKPLTPNWIHRLSRVTLCLMLGVGNIFLCFYTIPSSYVSNGRFCTGRLITTIPQEFRTVTVMRRFAVGGGLFLLQALLLILFVYPMACTRQKAKTVPDKNTDAISQVIHRSLISAIVAVISDSVALAILGNTPWGSPTVVTDVVYNTTIMINLCCVICTFKNPLRIFFVFCMTRNDVSSQEV